MSEARKRSNRKQEKLRTVKTVSFNKERESKLLEYANSIEFSVHVKELLEAELKLKGLQDGKSKA